MLSHLCSCLLQCQTERQHHREKVLRSRRFGTLGLLPKVGQQPLEIPIDLPAHLPDPLHRPGRLVRKLAHHRSEPIRRGRTPHLTQKRNFGLDLVESVGDG